MVVFLFVGVCVFYYFVSCFWLLRGGVVGKFDLGGVQYVYKGGVYYIYVYCVLFVVQVEVYLFGYIYCIVGNIIG